MGKIDYKSIRWNAATNWEFCGTLQNMKEMLDRRYARTGVRCPLDFGYEKADHTLAFDMKDVVIYHEAGDRCDGKFATVYAYSGGSLWILFADGETRAVRPDKIAQSLSIAPIPAELMELARAEAGSVDISKCPLKNEVACMNVK